jgi:alpha-tubulin suppressor-like RCC1 family protein
MSINLVAAGYYNTVGLRSDGTVVAVGNNVYGQCDVGNWTSIEQIASGTGHTIGLETDGTVVAAGRDDYGQSDVGLWDLD